MQFRETIHYDQPPDLLLKIFCDQDYFLEKYARTGARNIQLEKNEQTAERSLISVRRDVDMEIPIPRFARKYIPHTVSIVQTDCWNKRDATGHIDINVRGMPAQVTCDMTMEAAGQGTTLVLDFTVRVRMPLVGNALAELLARDMRGKVKEDESTGRAAAEIVAPRYTG